MGWTRRGLGGARDGWAVLSSVEPGCAELSWRRKDVRQNWIARDESDHLDSANVLILPFFDPSRPPSSTNRGLVHTYLRPWTILASPLQVSARQTPLFRRWPSFCSSVQPEHRPGPLPSQPTCSIDARRCCLNKTPLICLSRRLQLSRHVISVVSLQDARLHRHGRVRGQLDVQPESTRTTKNKLQRHFRSLHEFYTPRSTTSLPFLPDPLGAPVAEGVSKDIKAQLSCR